MRQRQRGEDWEVHFTDKSPLAEEIGKSHPAQTPCQDNTAAKPLKMSLLCWEHSLPHAHLQWSQTPWWQGLGSENGIGRLPSLEVTNLPRAANLLTELGSIFPHKSGGGRQPSESCSFHALFSFLTHSTAWQTSVYCSWALLIPAQNSGLLCVELEMEGGMRQPWLRQHNVHPSSHHHLKVF